MQPALIAQLVAWGIPELIKLEPMVAAEIRNLLDQGDKADWTTLRKFVVPFAQAVPNSEIPAGQ